jgi:hypothetical protein
LLSAFNGIVVVTVIFAGFEKTDDYGMIVPSSLQKTNGGLFSCSSLIDAVRCYSDCSQKFWKSVATPHSEQNAHAHIIRVGLSLRRFVAPYLYPFR